MNATYTIRYNRTTNHISGLDAATIDNGTTWNACGALTRGSAAGRLADGKKVETVEEALKSARLAGGRKICKSCEKAALAMIEAAKVEEVEVVAETAPVAEVEVAAPAAKSLAVLVAYSNGTREIVRVTSVAEAKTRIHLARKSGHQAIQTVA